MSETDQIVVCLRVTVEVQLVALVLHRSGGIQERILDIVGSCKRDLLVVDMDSALVAFARNILYGVVHTPAEPMYIVDNYVRSAEHNGAGAYSVEVVEAVGVVDGWSNPIQYWEKRTGPG